MPVEAVRWKTDWNTSKERMLNQGRKIASSESCLPCRYCICAIQYWKVKTLKIFFKSWGSLWKPGFCILLEEYDPLSYRYAAPGMAPLLYLFTDSTWPGLPLRCLSTAPPQPQHPPISIYIYSLLNKCCNFFFFLGLYLWHMEIPRLQVQSELQLLAYNTATAMQDLSQMGDLYHSSGTAGSLTHWAGQRWKLYPHGYQSGS